MTQILSYEQLRREGPPTQRDLEEAIALVREFGELPFVLGGAIVGSVAKGDMNPLSDIDAVFVYDNLSSTAAFFFKKELEDKIIDKHGVAPNILILPRSLAASGRHDWNNDFLAHIEYCIRAFGSGMKVESIYDLVKKRPFTDEEEYRWYLVAKHRQLREFASSSWKNEDDLRRRLGKFLDVPVHVARKLLQLNEFEKHERGKAAVLDTFKGKFPRAVSTHLAKVFEIRKRYVAEVTSSAFGDTFRTHPRYSVFVENLYEDSISPSLMFLDWALENS